MYKFLLFVKFNSHNIYFFLFFDTVFQSDKLKLRNFILNIYITLILVWTKSWDILINDISKYDGSTTKSLPLISSSNIIIIVYNGKYFIEI